MKIQDFINEITLSVVNKTSSITLFIGSGFSIWYGYPSWSGLFNDFCDKVYAEFSVDYDFISELKKKVKCCEVDIPRAFDLIMHQFTLDANYLRSFIVKLFEETNRTNRYKNLKKIGVDTEKYYQLCNLNNKYKIITTNYDTLVETMFEFITGNLPLVFYADSMYLNTKYFLNNTGGKQSILKLHGDVIRQDNMIISEQDYLEFSESEKYRLVREALKNNFSTSINIFLGYSLRDENIRKLLLENNNIYGMDKAKAYIFNINPMNNILVNYDKELENKYNEIGVEEIVIRHFDELLAVLRHLNMLKELDEYLLMDAFPDQPSLSGLMSKKVFMKWNYAFALFNKQCYTSTLSILESIVENYDESDEKFLILEPVYCLMGVLLECSENASSSEKGKSIIHRAIDLIDDLERLYANIGNLYWVRSMKRIYSSDLSEKFGALGTDRSILDKAKYYLNLVDNKSNFVKYQLIDIEWRQGNSEKAEELCKEFTKELNYHPKIDLIWGFIIFSRARIVQNSTIRRIEYLSIFEESRTLIGRYIDSKEYKSETNENKDKILNPYIQCLLAIEDYEAAIKYCNELMSINPSGENLHRYLIEIYIYQKDYDKAIEECSYEIDHTPDIGNNLIKIQYIKAMCIYASAVFHHDIIEAIKMCENILERHDYVDVTHTIGQMYQSIGEYKKMREYTIKACYLDPLNESLYKHTQSLLQGHFVGEEAEYDIQWSFDELGKLYKHRQEYEAAAHRPRRNLYLYRNLISRPQNGYRRLYLKDYVAVKDFLLGVDSNDLSDSIMGELDSVFQNYNRGNYSVVFESLRKYKDLLWNNHIYRYVYANILCQQDNFEAAKEIYEQILKLDITKFRDCHKKIIYYFYGEYWSSIKDYKIAEHYYRKASDIDRNFYKALFNLGLVNWEKAIENNNEYNFFQTSANYFEECIKLEPTIWEAYDNLCSVYEYLGMPGNIISNSLKLRGFVLPVDVKIMNYIRLIKFYMQMSDDDNAKKMIDEVEAFIGEVLIDDDTAPRISQYYCIKGVYYSDISYEKSFESVKKSYEIWPTEETRKQYEISKDPATTYHLEYGDLYIVRGGLISSG